MAAPIGVRCESGKRRHAAVSSSLKPKLATSSTRSVVDRERDEAAVRAEQFASLLEGHVVDRLGGQGARQRGREALQPRRHRPRALGTQPCMALRGAHEADDQLREREHDHADRVPRALDAEPVVRRDEVVDLRDQCERGRDQARRASADERGGEHEQHVDDGRRGRAHRTRRVRGEEQRRDEDGKRRARRDGEPPMSAREGGRLHPATVSRSPGAANLRKGTGARARAIITNC